MNTPATEDRAIARPLDLLKSACRIYTAWMIGRYLIVNAEGRQDGAEKAERHRQLVLFYVAVAHGCDPEYAGRDYPEDYERLHEASQELTSYMDEAIGFPIKGTPDYQDLEPKFFERFHEIAVTTLALNSYTASQKRIEALTRLIVDSQKPHGTCYWGMGFLFTSETQEACTRCAANREMKAIAAAALKVKP